MKLLEFKNPSLRYFEKIAPPTNQLKFPLNQVSLRKLINPDNPNQVSFFLNQNNALFHWAKSIDLGRGDVVGVIAPYPREFSELIHKTGATLRLLPRDCDEIVNIDLSSFKAIMLSNPNLADSFYYPKNIYQSFIEKTASYPQLHIMCEESLCEFFQHIDMPAPGSLSKSKHSRLTVLSGTYSFTSDSLSWLIKPKTNSVSQEIISKNIPVYTHALLTLKEARSFKHFSRRLFIMEHNLVRFMGDLRPALLKGAIKIHHWPKPRALYVMIDISPILQSERVSVENWVDGLHRNTGIVVDSGASFGAPNSIRVCLAYGFRHLREVANILCLYFCNAITEK